MKKHFSAKLLSVIFALVFVFSSFSISAVATTVKCDSHVFDDGVFIKEPTCTQAGTVLYSCCNCEYSKKEIVVPAGHFYGYDYLEETYIAPTCVSEGYEHYVLTCPKCEEVILEIENVLTEEEHKWTDVEVLRRETCAKEGIMAVVCELCGEEDTRLIYPNNDHSSKSGGIPAMPTCTEDGYYDLGYCEECKTDLGWEKVPAYGHSKDNYRLIKEPTCTEPGLAYYNCTNYNYNGACGFVGEEEIPALGHNYVKDGVWIGSDCCVQGRDPGFYCTTCGDVLVETTYPEYFEHDFKIDILAVADAENNGRALYTCQNETETSWLHVFEIEYSISDVIPEVSEDGNIIVNTDKTGVVGNIRDITGLDEENVVFEVIEENNAILDENSNIVVSGDGYIKVWVKTPAHEAIVMIETKICDSLEIIAENEVETGRVLEFEVVKNPGSVVATDVQWTSSDEDVVFVSDGRLVAIGTGTVVLTATVGDLSASKEITLVTSSDSRSVKFVAVDKMHYIIEDYYLVFNGETLYWSDASTIRFKVHTYETFPFETYIVYANGSAITADADGYYTISADSGEVRIAVSGAMYEENDNGTAEKINFWQAIINFFKKIFSFFGIK